ncbi:MAG: rod shape-determining protein MreC [Chitinivibrionales bacterium]|nr:rod shape-determining protein MreC [Chitinivibrionales bacterium]MBD3357160.1 rod shape-determining protein MreC [Chitinivibrionales bacterium]
MHWIFAFVVQHRNLFSLLLTVFLSLWMINAQPAAQRRIARALTFSIFYPFQFTVNQVTRARNIFAENRRLREEVTQLTTRLAQLEDRAVENERLREMLEFERKTELTLLPARVIAREPSSLYRAFVANRGSAHEVRYDMPVVNNHGLVGKVVQALPHISLVQLLKDPSARTSVMNKRSRVVAILETENGRDFFAQYRTPADIVVGDTIVTSGLGGVFPKGLFVGTVEKIKEGYDPLFKRVFVEPFVTFEHLEEVFIVKRPPEWTAVDRELDSLEMER